MEIAGGYSLSVGSKGSAVFLVRYEGCLVEGTGAQNRTYQQSRVRSSGSTLSPPFGTEKVQYLE